MKKSSCKVKVPVSWAAASTPLQLLPSHLPLSAGTSGTFIVKLHTPPANGRVILGSLLASGKVFRGAQMMINERATTRLSWPPPVIVVTAELISPSNHSALGSLIQEKLTLRCFYVLVYNYARVPISPISDGPPQLYAFSTRVLRCIFLESKRCIIRCEPTSILSFRRLPAKKLYQQKLCCPWSLTVLAPEPNFSTTRLLHTPTPAEI